MFIRILSTTRYRLFINLSRLLHVLSNKLPERILISQLRVRSFDNSGLTLIINVYIMCFVFYDKKKIQ